MWVDINVHLELMSTPADQVLKDAHAANVTYIATGTHPEQWHWLEDRTPHVAFGLHPHYLTDQSDWLVTLEDLLHRDKQRAVGEIGIDFRHGMPESERQIRVFENQLSLAHSLNRAVIIHAVKSHHEVINSLKRVRCESDLSSARKVGLKTAFVLRSNEHGVNQKSDLKPLERWDYVANAFCDLAAKLGCEKEVTLKGI